MVDLIFNSIDLTVYRLTDFDRQLSSVIRKPHTNMNPGLHYADYLKLEKLLDIQELKSDLQQVHAHDEMLFIVIHQAYELWFKQLLYEVGFCKSQSLKNLP